MYVMLQACCLCEIASSSALGGSLICPSALLALVVSSLSYSAVCYVSLSLKESRCLSCSDFSSGRCSVSLLTPRIIFFHNCALVCELRSAVMPVQDCSPVSLARFTPTWPIVWLTAVSQDSAQPLSIRCGRQERGSIQESIRRALLSITLSNSVVDTVVWHCLAMLRTFVLDDRNLHANLLPACLPLPLFFTTTFKVSALALEGSTPSVNITAILPMADGVVRVQTRSAVVKTQTPTPCHSRVENADNAKLSFFCRISFM